jgi:hypothetical protein
LTFRLDIPEAVANSLRLPVVEIEPRLRSELAGVSRYVFADILLGRNIPRHYNEDDLALDLDYARGQ